MKEQTAIITQEQARSVASLLCNFYEFTFFSERDVTEEEGLKYSLEFQYISMGLHTEGDKIDEVRFQEFVTLVDQAGKSEFTYWQFIEPSLPMKKCQK